MKKMNWIVISLISVLFAINYLLAESYDKYNTWELLIGNRHRIMISCVKSIVISLVVGAILFVFFSMLNRFKMRKSNRTEDFLFDRHPISVPIIIMLIGWLPNFILYFPGVVTYDAVRQFEQFFSGEFTNHHPIVTTLIEGFFAKIGLELGNIGIGISFYLSILFIITVAVFSYGFLWMHKRKIPYFVRWMTLVFFACFPYWSAYARTVVKDSLFYPLFFLYIINYFELILNEKKVLDKRCFIKYVFFSVCLPLIRHNGWYVVLGTMFLMIFWKKEFRKKALILFVCFGVFFNLYNSILLPVCGIAPGGKQEMLSIPFQQTARYIKYHKSEVTEDEREAIDKVLDYETIGKVYNPNLSDPVKGTYKREDQYLGDYFNIWLRQLKKHPATYVQATLNGTYGYLGYKSEIKHPFGYYTQPTYDDVYNKKYVIRPIEQLEKTRDQYYQVLNYIFEKTPLKVLCQPMLYTWMFIIMFGYSMTQKKLRRYWIVFSPIFMLYALCFASPVNADMRYMLPITSVCFLYVGFMLRQNRGE